MVTEADRLHERLVGYLVRRMLGEAVVVIGATPDDAAAALRHALRIAGHRELPLELVAPDRFVALDQARRRGLSRYLADTLVLTPDAHARLDDPVVGPVLGLPGDDQWEAQGSGWFRRRSGASEALAGSTVVQPGVDGPQIVRLDGEGWA